MPDHDSPNLEPVKAGRQALVGGTVGFLTDRPLLRSAFALTGTLLLAIGLIAAPFWSVPLLSWLTFGQVAGVSLTGGLGAIGLWHLSRPRKPAAANERTRRCD
jgi:hypothetical protein